MIGITLLSIMMTFIILGVCLQKCTNKNLKISEYDFKLHDADIKITSLKQDLQSTTKWYAELIKENEKLEAKLLELTEKCKKQYYAIYYREQKIEKLEANNKNIKS